jgi:hypothetical protein
MQKALRWEAPLRYPAYRRASGLLKRLIG